MKKITITISDTERTIGYVEYEKSAIVAVIRVLWAYKRNFGGRFNSIEVKVENA